MRAMAGVNRTSPHASESSSTFVELSENRSALLAIRLVGRRLCSRMRCGSFSTALLHGPSGSGKSHLTDALLEQVAPHGTVVRQAAADWVNSDESLILEVRQCDLLIIEDLQYLPAHANSALVATLDCRQSRGRATVLTASAGPGDLTNLQGRLVNRIAAGLVVRIDPLSMESRQALLRVLAERKGITVQRDTLECLARLTRGSGRQLIAALNWLQAHSANRPEMLDSASLALSFEPFATINGLTPERITQHVARTFHIEPRLIRSSARNPSVVKPRQVCMYLTRQLTGLSLGRIGVYFGRDSSTARQACQKIAGELSSDENLAATVRQLSAELEG